MIPFALKLEVKHKGTEHAKPGGGCHGTKGSGHPKLIVLDLPNLQHSKSVRPKTCNRLSTKRVWTTGHSADTKTVVLQKKMILHGTAACAHAGLSMNLKLHHDTHVFSFCTEVPSDQSSHPSPTFVSPDSSASRTREAGSSTEHLVSTKPYPCRRNANKDVNACSKPKGLTAETTGKRK